MNELTSDEKLKIQITDKRKYGRATLIFLQYRKQKSLL